jgi:hypothetical protein
VFRRQVTLYNAFPLLTPLLFSTTGSFGNDLDDRLAPPYHHHANPLGLPQDSHVPTPQLQRLSCAGFPWYSLSTSSQNSSAIRSSPSSPEVLETSAARLLRMSWRQRYLPRYSLAQPLVGNWRIGQLTR